MGPSWVASRSPVGQGVACASCCSRCLGAGPDDGELQPLVVHPWCGQWNRPFLFVSLLFNATGISSLYPESCMVILLYHFLRSISGHLHVRELPFRKNSRSQPSLSRTCSRRQFSSLTVAASENGTTPEL